MHLGKPLTSNRVRRTQVKGTQAAEKKGTLKFSGLDQERASIDHRVGNLTISKRTKDGGETAKISLKNGRIPPSVHDSDQEWGKRGRDTGGGGTLACCRVETAKGTT